MTTLSTICLSHSRLWLWRWPLMYLLSVTFQSAVPLLPRVGTSLAHLKPEITPDLFTSSHFTCHHNNSLNFTKCKHHFSPCSECLKLLFLQACYANDALFRFPAVASKIKLIVQPVWWEDTAKAGIGGKVLRIPKIPHWIGNDLDFLSPSTVHISSSA